MYFLGFDPGGRNQFGWCVAESTLDQGLRLIETGVDDNAHNAISSAVKRVVDSREITAVGIDSPLYWVMTGDRLADTVIRSEMIRKGAKYVHGTVQHVNSLQGACLVQGIITVHLLREKFPMVRITETHPKALLWLIEVATRNQQAADVKLSHLAHVISCDSVSVTEHERDAALGSFAAWAMVKSAHGWRDLYQLEEEPFAPVPPVEYWMPIENIPDGTVTGDA